jgi:hypothetical protein
MEFQAMPGPVFAYPSSLAYLGSSVLGFGPLAFGVLAFRPLAFGALAFGVYCRSTP